ncbi:MAG: hypothetical protein JWQ27_1616 [Ferruginibacter sp.]|nr:hypothetical protein [Ferruginibacter sp.]
MALKSHKTSTMNSISSNYAVHPIIQTLKNFVGKLRQQPDSYPIRYYKKGQRHKRNWKTDQVN